MNYYLRSNGSYNKFCYLTDLRLGTGVAATSLLVSLFDGTTDFYSKNLAYTFQLVRDLAENKVEENLRVQEWEF